MLRVAELSIDHRYFLKGYSHFTDVSMPNMTPLSPPLPPSLFLFLFHSLSICIFLYLFLPSLRLDPFLSSRSESSRGVESARSCVSGWPLAAAVNQYPHCACHLSFSFTRLPSPSVSLPASHSPSTNPQSFSALLFPLSFSLTIFSIYI